MAHSNLSVLIRRLSPLSLSLSLSLSHVVRAYMCTCVFITHAAVLLHFVTLQPSSIQRQLPVPRQCHTFLGLAPPRAVIALLMSPWPLRPLNSLAFQQSWSGSVFDNKREEPQQEDCPRHSLSPLYTVCEIRSSSLLEPTASQRPVNAGCLTSGQSGKVDSRKYSVTIKVNCLTKTADGGFKESKNTETWKQPCNEADLLAKVSPCKVIFA